MGNPSLPRLRTAIIKGEGMGRARRPAASPPCPVWRRSKSVAKVVRVHDFGGPEVMRVEDVQLEAPGPGQVHVRLRAAGVNPVDRSVRLGGFARPPLPYVPGQDGAGEVVAVGEGVQRVGPGQRVYVAGAPTYAEEAVVPEGAVWPLPDGISFEEGAAIGVPYVTAYRALHHASAAQPGDWVLVHGGSGGVGTAALQLGRAAGFRMVGTSSTEQGRRHVLAQGAEAAYGHDDTSELLAVTSGAGYRVILELHANTQTLSTALELLATGGEIVVIGNAGPAEIAPGALMAKAATLRGITGRTLTASEQARIHTALGALLALGVLRPVVGQKFPLAEAGRAQEELARGGVVGKIVLVP
jgi:NADPH2:quinone reductase